jgi:hypothetical protein
MDEVKPGPGWSWISVGVEVYEGGDPDDPGGAVVVVPDRLRVIRSQGGRSVMRVDVKVTAKDGGGWFHGVTGLEVFGDDDHLVDTATLRSLGLDRDVDAFVRSQMRVRTPAAVEGAGFQAEVEAWERATFEPVDPSNVGVRAAAGNARPAGPAVPRQERRKVIDAEVEEAARLYREVLHKHEAGDLPGKAKPVEYVRTVTGWSQRTAARRIEQARERGLLPATTKGRAKA